MSKKEPKVAIVHDWLVGYAGGDRVVDAMKHVFPNAVIYTLVYDPNNMPEWFKSYDIRTSWFQKVPFSNKLYKAMLPLMPAAFEAFDLTEYDLVLSSCSSCSKGVITRPDAVHICYCHTPIRYVWDFYYTYRANANWLARLVMPGQMHKMRVWDKCAADRVDYFIANSHYISQRIKKYYRRDSDVIYPGCHINEAPFVEKEDFYLTVGRLTWYKRVDLAVQACTKLGKRLVVIGGGGELDKLKAMAGPTCGPRRSFSRVKRTSASRRWKPRARVRRCWPMAAAARARALCPARPATGSKSRPSKAWPTASSGLSATALPILKKKFASTAAVSARNALSAS